MSSKNQKGIALIVIPLQAFLAIYFLLRGHHEPGGGFIAGLMAAAGATFYAITYGDLPQLFRKFTPMTFISVGLLISFISGFMGVFAGGTYLKGVWGPEFFLPFVGSVKIGSVMFFDFGVFFVVLGFTLQLVRALREEIL